LVCLEKERERKKEKIILLLNKATVVLAFNFYLFWSFGNRATLAPNKSSFIFLGLSLIKKLEKNNPPPVE